LLDRWHERYGVDLAGYTKLGAAVCVVFDGPVTFRVNENKVTAPDPMEVFEYFRSNESRLILSVRETPPEVLVSMIDVTSPIEELRWALEKYRGDARIGQRYFDVKYDLS